MPMELAQVVVGPWFVNGYTGVAKLGSSAKVQLRVPPLLPWPAWTNQSRPKGVVDLSVAFLIRLGSETEPSEQVV